MNFISFHLPFFFSPNSLVACNTMLVICSCFCLGFYFWWDHDWKTFFQIEAFVDGWTHRADWREIICWYALITVPEIDMIMPWAASVHLTFVRILCSHLRYSRVCSQCGICRLMVVVVQKTMADDVDPLVRVTSTGVPGSWDGEKQIHQTDYGSTFNI